MQFFVYFTLTPDKPMRPPAPDGMARMSQFMENSFEQGLIVATGQLPRKVTQVTLEGGELSISDGPFTEGKEMIPGFTIIETNSREDAIAWAGELQKCMGDGTIKIAQLVATSRQDLKMQG
jgi:hypothetical protein